MILLKKIKNKKNIILKICEDRENPSDCMRERKRERERTELLREKEEGEEEEGVCQHKKMN